MDAWQRSIRLYDATHHLPAINKFYLVPIRTRFLSLKRLFCSLPLSLPCSIYGHAHLLELGQPLGRWLLALSWRASTTEVCRGMTMTMELLKSDWFTVVVSVADSSTSSSSSSCFQWRWSSGWFTSGESEQWTDSGFAGLRSYCLKQTEGPKMKINNH